MTASEYDDEVDPLNNRNLMAIQMQKLNIEKGKQDISIQDQFTNRITTKRDSIFKSDLDGTDQQTQTLFDPYHTQDNFFPIKNMNMTDGSNTME